MMVQESLGGALSDLMRWLLNEQIPGVIVGGVAASILGRPRLTRDVDAVVLADDLDRHRLLQSAAKYGLTPRVADALEFAERTRVLLLRHEPSGVDLDISLGGLPFERELVERSVMTKVGPLHLRLPTPEDVIIMKALARRSRDIADIEAILDVQPDVDLGRIRRWLREFSSVLEMPEIHDDFERLLKRKAES